MNLSLQNIAATYKSADGAILEAVREVTLEVQAGQAIALIGPSGCGKSTLLRIASGLLSPTHGSVRVDGEELMQPRAETALILQDFGLLPWKTVYKNAELGLRIRGIAKDERQRRTMRALEQVGLANMATRYPKELSGGMQQRLALARALALDVDLLLMDEPLSALDALLRESLQETLLNLWKNNRHAHILVTHSIEEAVYLGQRIVVLSPRPARIAAVIENPLMGTDGFRATSEYFERCTKVREALNQAVATPCDAGLSAHEPVCATTDACETPDPAQSTAAHDAKGRLA